MIQTSVILLLSPLTGTLLMNLLCPQLLVQSPVFSHPSIQIQLLHVLQSILPRFSSHYLHQLLLPVYIPQYHHLTSHFIHHQEKILKSLQTPHHLTCLERSLTQLHILTQVILPVKIHPHSNQSKNQRNPLPLSPLNKSPQFLHHHCLLITHHWYLFWILLLLPVLSPVSLHVLIIQIYFSIMIHMYYPTLHLQEPIS